MSVLIRSRQRFTPPRRSLRAAVQAALAAEGVEAPVEVSLLLVGDEEMSRLNQRYLGRAGATDVLAFPQQDCGRKAFGPEGERLLGDVVVSVETAQRQARRLGHSLERELCELAVHGVLHLLGWSDATAQERRRMLRRGRQLATQALGAKGA